ncbi:DNA-binding transcriptional regulator, MerR family [Paenibacillus uliginis N3/975]|uniref:DNA-binding transcriptional regulator, MerR family n=1 Tax=Paenibacillus uliginis N3/975 TaxID=1313296 RepID=A0A1X7GI18_9BACL|nr:MerR family transcriptional regulator [Paenibacillus uliginis]SMF69369.1 DNA-binding transcriptional regulator, MerR family [Paenibacillus uliginis N3/975]
MNNDLLLIKDFSKLTGLSRKALYIYDEHNILNPVFIHPDNDYRYYDKNQLLTAKRINLLKQAGFTLNDISKIIHRKLSDDEINNLIEEKLQLEMNKIKEANQAINKLKELNHPIAILNNEVNEDYLESLIVYEYELLPNENICVALNNSEEMINELNVKKNEKIIKYKMTDNKIHPVSIALPLENQELNQSGVTRYFGFQTQKFFCEIDPYQEESVLRINEIMKNNELELSEPYIYERILTPDDYLYSSKRLSEFIFPSKY